MMATQGIPVDMELKKVITYHVVLWLNIKIYVVVVVVVDS